jgi:glycosyltransferase involved in cell wall biosynthesis
MRYLWESSADYFQFGRGRRWKGAALSAISPWLRRFDRKSAAGVNFFIANSENVRRRIRRIYGADAKVIYPPVDTGFFTPASGETSAGDYYLVASSLEPYKRIDLAVDAFSHGRRRLVIAGKGTLQRQLRARARSAPRSAIEFLSEVSDEKLRDLYRHCRALIFPGLEDFGMTPVEAQACGRPVVCYGAGGAIESVIDGETGVHFRPQTSAALLDAVERFEKMPWDPARIRARSLRFSRQRFQDEMRTFFSDIGVPIAA